MAKYKATIFIPTWFGEAYLTDLLAAVFRQKVAFNYEVLVYDTSSTDKTPEILKDFSERHDNMRVKTISKENFGHGRTRQEAAKDSDSEIIVYLSQDAIPANNQWLHEMVKPFEISNEIVAVVGRQIPRHNAIPMLKYEINAVFNGLGSPHGTTLYRQEGNEASEGMVNFLGFYSDVNSAARRHVLINEIPYRDVTYAEDQLFGRDVIQKGYTKAYAGMGAVVHSNDILLREYKHRMYDETVGLRGVGIAVGAVSLPQVVKNSIKGSLKDTGRILTDPAYVWKRKLYWLTLNPLFHVQKWRGIRLGSKTKVDDTLKHQKYSLEKQRERQQTSR